MVAHWADEASRAEGTGAPEARAHSDEDRQAAISRAHAETADRPRAMRRLFDRLRHPAR
jgi:hypothetical protein